jgi:AcrR family transcriptional regulator
MNAKEPDLRVRRTRKLLQAALLCLLQERELESISVNEICESAMVHRTTFYKHYQDKYDLLQQSMQELFTELRAGMPTPQEAVAQTTESAAPPHFVRMFEHAAANRTFYAAMLASGAGQAFRRLLEDTVAEAAEARIEAITAEKGRLPVPLPVLAQFSAGALVRLLIWWLEQKQPLPATEMAQHTARLLNDGMLSLLRGE